jgi:hypothetical protein
VQQGIDRLAHGLLLRPPIKALGSLVPEGDAVGQVAHDDGVTRLVEQRRLAPYVRVGGQTLNFG